jgi:transposase
MTRNEEADWSVAMEAIETPDTSSIALHREDLRRKGAELIFLSRRTQLSHEIQSLGSLRRPETFTQEARGLIFRRGPRLGEPPRKKQSAASPRAFASTKYSCLLARSINAEKMDCDRVQLIRNSIRFILTAGQANDIVQAENLISGLSFDKLLGDMDFDSDRFRGRIAPVGAEAVIPSARSRSQAIPYDKHIYQERNLVERFFNKIKHFRRIATRYEKTALSLAAMLFLVGAAIWLR